MRVIYVRKALAIRHNSLYIKEFIPEINPADVANVREASAVSHSSFIRELRQEQSPTLTMNVGKRSPLNLASLYIKNSYRGKTIWMQ